MVWAFIFDSHWLYLLMHPVVVILFTLRIIWIRRPPGVALAWILIVTIVPVIGLIAYFMIGERPIGRDRKKRIERATPVYQRMTALLDERYPNAKTQIAAPFQSMARLAEHHGGMPPVQGNRITLHSDTEQTLHALMHDIDQAHQRCDLEFYIWNPGGTADEVAEVLMRAAQRGVFCRVLLDELGSAAFWKSHWPGRMRHAGVHLVKACAIHPLELQFGRADLRLHRKIVAIDQQIAWTGSMNMVDPAFFKQNAGVGEWIDAMVRVEGPVAEALTIVFEGDWAVESNNIPGFSAYLDTIQKSSPAAYPAGIVAQAVPSGPSYKWTNMSHVLLSAILDAKNEVVMTTPYFVPDDALFQGLQTAAARGVNVTLIVPQRIDSLLVRYASRSYMDDLISAGVRIQQFSGGLLHTKSLVVDRAFSLFGSVNLDMRSLRLNYEITLMVYDNEFSAQLRALQDQYLAKSLPIDPLIRANRSLRERLAENAAQLVSPLL
ncbi:MAG: cardiolipin synthase [Rhodocyclaceae bacterium]|nr:cardiolipin synthase [Rhodocyclaceae bacterium]